MLRQLRSDDPHFKTVYFHGGLNLLVARSTRVSQSTDSRNGAGKSSLVELLHFLLGGRADRSTLAVQPALKDRTFTLDLDWPGLADGPLSVSRRGRTAKQLTLRPDVALGRTALFTAQGTVSLSQWQELIERRLFGLAGEHPGVSGRTLLSFLMRKVGDHGFNEATRSFSRQSEAQSTPSLAYLLGLDSDLVAKYQGLAARKAAREQLKKAVDDPVLGKVVGNTADLRGQIAIQQSTIDRFKGQIAAFRVVPQYEDLKERADDVSRRIRELSSQDAIDRRNLDHLEKSVAETDDPEVRYLAQVYKDLDIQLPDQVLKRFDEVQRFHTAVVRNRRGYLAEEIEDTRRRLQDRKAERARLDVEQAALLKELNEGGALEALTTLQRALAHEEAALQALQHRLEAAEAIESSSREIEASRIDLQRAVGDDLRERAAQTNKATLLFNTLVQRLYGTERPSYLTVEAGKNSLKITPKINSDVSQGINRMAIYCMDLTLAVIAHREGRAPDFLVHDSHLFDGVDERQLYRALEIGAQLAADEGMQYIITINEDELNKAEAQGFHSRPHLIEPQLTDAYEGGGLFGFRFDHR